jgi:hypothetical protein
VRVVVVLGLSTLISGASRVHQEVGERDGPSRLEV